MPPRARRSTCFSRPTPTVATRSPGGPTAPPSPPPVATARGNYGTPAEGKILTEHEAGALWAEHLAWSTQPVGDRGHLLALGAGNKVTLWNEKGEASGEGAQGREERRRGRVDHGRHDARHRDKLRSDRARSGRWRGTRLQIARPDSQHGLQPLGQMAHDRQPGLLRARLEYRQRRRDAHARLRGQGAPARVASRRPLARDRWRAVDRGLGLLRPRAGGAHADAARMAYRAGQRAALSARGRLARVRRARRRHRHLVAHAARQPGQPREDRERRDARRLVARRQAARRRRRKAARCRCSRSIEHPTKECP